ncbi:MAG: hypothetical protein JWQ45_2528 [Blastococcus sp.]|jgi:hypothetical protein|nr:hypothetical protein [Blastococcus sp.]
MTEPASGEPVPRAVAPHDPTLRVDRPPVPGRAARAEVADGSRPMPPIRVDEPTISIAGSQPKARHRTLEFGAPAPVKVTVGPRAKPRRRHRTWPWILAVVLALVALGVTLLVMLLHGGTIDGNTDVVGLAGGTGMSVSAPEVGGR